MINVLDQSGSMDNLKETVVSDYNKFLHEFKQDSNDIRWTTVMFNDNVTTINDDSIKNIEDLKDDDYKPEFKTALLDAIGNVCIKIINNSVEYNDIVINIFTDGEENSSKNYTYGSVNEIMESLKNKNSLETNFYCTDNNSLSCLLKIPSIDYSYVNANFSNCMRQMSSHSQGSYSYPSSKKQKK